MSQNVLLVVDDEVEFAELLPVLHELAEGGLGLLTLATVVPFSAVMVNAACAGISAYEQVRFMVEQFEVCAAAARSHLRRLSHQARMAGYAADTAVACGAPFEEIARLAENLDARVIVMIGGSAG